MTERKRWRRVPGWPGYKVSSRGGQVRGPRGLLTPAPDKDGYPCVTLRDGKRSRYVAVHTLVLEAFDRPRPDGTECRHLNDVRTDADLSNLCWGTHRENERDKMKRKGWIETEVASRPPISLQPVSSGLRQ